MNLWQECLICKDKCCKWDMAFPLFVTPLERTSHPKLNTQHPCAYFGSKELCEIHKERPFDCRLFPFEIAELNGKFFWIIWNVNCSILKKNKDFEPYLQEHEKILIPKFKKHIKEYAHFRFEELTKKYKYKIIREVKF